jgi:hypothetical protein
LIPDKSKALVLEADELADAGGNEQAARNQMRLDVCRDLRTACSTICAAINCVDRHELY